MWKKGDKGGAKCQLVPDPKNGVENATIRVRNVDPVASRVDEVTFVGSGLGGGAGEWQPSVMSTAFL